ncbi:hypothetical protein H6G74_04790 [Nostoc spongiaeforme FACHB-130]|uniref:Uncharacterized protein n=1 Tax=Nostoc spongiaeforme FACHB-130 TaxID=1357510 RepID=A0ABR8FQR7_9NOSO|nr:hypothetical protein [Nostoc spongiaeforme]MBD2593646.1 hypothetical protein [Nostoc spongiaeforme FACHB-130]
MYIEGSSQPSQLFSFAGLIKSDRLNLVSGESVMIEAIANHTLLDL